MRFRLPRALFTLSLGLALIPVAHSQGALPPDVKNFATQYIAAINAKDEARLTALYSSQSRACIAAEDRDFYKMALDTMWHEPIPSNATITVSAVNEGNLKAIESFGAFPAKPTRELHIDYQVGNDGGLVIVYLVTENGHWAADQPCPTAESVKQFHAGDAARAHYKQMAQEIQEPLRAQLIAFLRQHDTASAIDRYHAASGQDKNTSMLVIDALQQQLP
jgi:hypothetical protein